MLFVTGDMLRDIRVSQEVKEFVRKQGRDYRVSTTCGGAVLLPTSVKPPKTTDIEISIGDHTLYVSEVQARYIDEVTERMIRRYSFTRTD